MVRQCIDKRSLTFVRLNPNNKVKNFDCGDKDLNDFIVNARQIFKKACFLLVMLVQKLVQAGFWRIAVLQMTRWRLAILRVKQSLTVFAGSRGFRILNASKAILR